MSHAPPNLAVEVPRTFPAVEVPLPTNTPRHAARAALRKYILSLTFRRPGPGTKDELEFQLQPKDVVTEWPDPEKKLNYPSVAILGGPGVHQEINLTPTVVDDTFNVFSPGTALVQLSEWVETLQVSCWGSNRGERRALVAGLISAFSPTEEMFGFRLHTEDYFDVVANFYLLREENVEDEAIRGSRRADMYVEARCPVVKLMPFRPIVPQVSVDVSEQVAIQDTGVSLLATSLEFRFR